MQQSSPIYPIQFFDIDIKYQTSTYKFITTLGHILTCCHGYHAGARPVDCQYHDGVAAVLGRCDHHRELLAAESDGEQLASG